MMMMIARDSMEYYVYYKNAIIAHRSPSNPSLLIEVLPLYHHAEDSFLLYDMIDPLPKSWIVPQYDDSFWIPTSEIGRTHPDGNAYIRVHMQVPHVYANQVLLRMTVQSAVEVYVSGKLLFSEGLTAVNEDRHYRPIITMPLQPITYSHEIPLQLVVEDMVIAVKLLTSAEEDYPLVFAMEVVMITAEESQVTSITTKFDASPSLVVVCLNKRE